MTNICIYFYEKIDWNLLFDGISAVGTLGAFVFAIIIARNISFKRDLRKKQLDTVFNLVSHLQNLKMYFSAVIDLPDSSDGYSLDVWFHFFDMTTDKLTPEQGLNKGNPTILVSDSFLYENEIFKFVQNPFLPPNIALKLINLYPRGGNQLHHNSNRNQIYISDDRLYSSHTYRIEVSQYYLSIDKLFETTEKLSESIRTWLKDNGAGDLNFRDKPINIKNYP